MRVNNEGENNEGVTKKSGPMFEKYNAALRGGALAPKANLHNYKEKHINICEHM